MDFEMIVFWWYGAKGFYEKWELFFWNWGRKCGFGEWGKVGVGVCSSCSRCWTYKFLSLYNLGVQNLNGFDLVLVFGCKIEW